MLAVGEQIEAAQAVLVGGALVCAFAVFEAEQPRAATFDPESKLTLPPAGSEFSLASIPRDRGSKP